MNCKKGISLVALIITIIVLIILTGAVIIAINQGNIIGKSKEAVFKSNMVTYKEELRNNILKEQLSNPSFSKESIEASYKRTNTIEDAKTDKSDIRYWIPSITDEYASKLSIKSGKLIYTGTTNDEEETWATAMDMISTSNTSSTSSTFEVGQYIKYTPSNKSYVVEKALSGATGADYQQWCIDNGETAVGVETFETGITPETWRILSINGANITIMRNDPICPKEYPNNGVTLFGETGNNNAVVLLNKICAIYKNDTYATNARSITIGDINNVLGYTEPIESADPQEGEYGYLGYGANNNNYYEYNDITEMHNIASTSDHKYTMIFKNNLNEYKDYWIASPCIYADSNSVTYFMHNVRSSNVSGEDLYNIGGDGYYEALRTFGCLPVVTLKDTIQITADREENKGSSSNPWKIQ